MSKIQSQALVSSVGNWALPSQARQAETLIVMAVFAYFAGFLLSRLV